MATTLEPHRTADAAEPRRTGTASSSRLPDEHDYVVDEIEGRLPEGLDRHALPQRPGEERGRRQAVRAPVRRRRAALAVRVRRQAPPLPQPLRAHDALPRRARGGQAASCATTASSAPAARSANAFRMPANVANTSVQYHAGNLLALYEGGRPWQLDPDTLETLGEYDYDGELQGLVTRTPPTRRGTPPPASSTTSGSSTARARSCAPTASTRAASCTTCTRSPSVRDAQPRLRADVEVHGVRDRSGRPAACRASCSGSPASTSRCASTRSKATQVILAPRDGGKPRIAECEPFFHYHINNAFDDGDDVVLDLVRYPDYDNIHRGFRDVQALRLRRRSTTSLAGCGVSPSDEVDDRGHLSARLRVPAARLAPHEPAPPLHLPGRPGRRRRRARRAVQRDHQDRPRARRHHGARARRRDRSRASRSSCRARGQRRRTTAGCCRSSTRRPSTGRGWWCSTRATSSPTRSRSRICAITCRSDSTARSRAASRSRPQRRKPPAVPACLGGLAGLESIMREATSDRLVARTQREVRRGHGEPGTHRMDRRDVPRAGADGRRRRLRPFRGSGCRTGR